MMLTQKDKIQIVVIGLLLIFAIFWLGARGSQRGKNLKDQAAALAMAANAQAVPFYFKLETESKALAIDRDPFSRASPSSRKKSGELNLAGIVYEEGHSTAVINDQNVRVGEEIAGYQVISITPLAVTLRKGDQSIILELN